MLEFLDTKQTWIGIDEDGTETEYRTLVVFSTDRRDALYVIYTHDYGKDPEDMSVHTMKVVLHEDDMSMSLHVIDNTEDQELVERVFGQYKRCYRLSHTRTGGVLG